MRVFRQKPTQWHIAGEHRKHLSSYLYDAAAVVLPVAQAFHTAGVPLIHILLSSVHENNCQLLYSKHLWIHQYGDVLVDF